MKDQLLNNIKGLIESSLTNLNKSCVNKVEHIFHTLSKDDSLSFANKKNQKDLGLYFIVNCLVEDLHKLV